MLYKTKIVALHTIVFFSLCIIIPVRGNTVIKQEVDSITKLIDTYFFSEGKKSREWVTQLKSIAKDNPNDLSLLAKSVYYEAMINYNHGWYDSELLPRIDSLLNSNLFTDSHDIALLELSRGITYVKPGNYAAAFTSLLFALDEFEKSNDSDLITKTASQLGNLCRYIRNHNMAEFYYNKALDLCEPGSMEYYSIRLNICGIFYFRGQHEEAMECQKEMTEILETKNFPAVLIVSYLNLGILYMLDEDYENVLKTYNIIAELIEEIDNERLSIVYYQNLGDYYFHISDYDNAYHYAFKAKELLLKNNNMTELSRTYKSIANIFQKTNNIDSAFYYLNKYIELQGFLTANSQAIDVYQSYLSMLLETSENRLKLSDQELKLRSRQVMVVVISLASIILVVGLMFIISLQNRRNIRQKALLKEAENKELSDRLQQEKNMQRLQAEKLEDKLREISSYSLLLSNKNQILNQIDVLAGQLPAEDIKIKKISREIKSIVKNNQHADQDWNDFMIHFDKVHPRFFDKLQSSFGDLSQSDLKLAAYLRIGLSAKQIAQMVNVTPESLKARRYRLRKKLNLVSGEDLDAFIQSF